jgi:hypothetical protein
MENLFIKETKSTPRIELDAERHIHNIIGESYPENTKEFYTPVMNWLKRYLSKIDNETEVIFNFEIIYFNSSSSKALMDIFYIIDDVVSEEGKNIIINWIFIEENEAAEEYGEEFAEDLESVKFNLVIKEED